MPAALVTGGAGRIGSHVCTLLARAGFDVRAFDLPGVDFGTATASPGVTAVRGELTDPADVHAAAEGVSVAVHLAALLPPASEHDRAHTMAVNLDGTRLLVESLTELSPTARLLFSSSVVVYGDTSDREPPVSTDWPLRPLDIYAESKVAAERAVRESGLAWTILRIAGVATADVLEPPDPWPFTRTQRLEFVLREDVANALALVASTDRLDGRILHVAGGTSWRMRGERYALDYLQTLGLPDDVATFLERPLAFDWYEPAPELSAIGFQATTYEDYLQRMNDAISAFVESDAGES